MNIEDIKKLIELVDDHKIAQVEVEIKGVRVRITGHHRTTPVRYVPVPMGGGYAPAGALASHDASAVPALPAPVAAPAAPAAGPVAASAAPAAQAAPDGCPPNCVEVTAPMVGTFYRAPAPDAAPFAEVGVSVREDSTVCIIEAMKLMNEIKAEIKGIIRKILVENGQPVEYGQPLFYVEKA